MPPIITSITGASSASTAKVNGITKVAVPTPAPAPVPVPTIQTTATGSVVGNIFREIGSAVSGGHFGQGEAKRREGESDEEYYARLARAAGAAAQTFKDQSSKNSNTNDMADSFKSGATTAAITAAVQKYAPTVIVIGVGVWAVKKFILKKGAKRRAY